MQLVEQHIINKSNKFYKELDNICFLSKNLYNTALYHIRNQYFNEKTFLNYNSIDKKLKNEKQVDYYSLPSKVSQQTLKLVDKNFKSFFSLLKLKNNKNYNKPVNIPKYLNKLNGRYVTTYTNQAISFKKKGFINLSKTNVFIKTSKQNINQVRVIPKINYLVIEIVYTVNEKELKINNERYCSIDPGLNNLATISSNCLKPIIINGKPLKSINHYYNRKLSKLKSNIILKTKNKQKTTKKIQRLTVKRNNKIKDY